MLRAVADFRTLLKAENVNRSVLRLRLLSEYVLTQVHLVPKDHCWFLPLATFPPDPAPAHVRLGIGAVEIQAEVGAASIISNSK